MEPTGSVTELLRRCQSGDQSAWEAVVPILYEDLRRLARQRLRFNRNDETLGTTALVHECYLRLVQGHHLDVSDRNQFLAAASLTMRRVLTDYARTKGRLKRGGGQRPEPIEEVAEWLSDENIRDVLSIDEALCRLKQMDERAALVVDLRFFGGLSIEEAAEVMAVSTKTVQRIWRAARAWLRTEIEKQPSMGVSARRAG